jgi:two-component system sensor histidine kinase PilS (NtrC family)
LKTFLADALLRPFGWSRLGLAAGLVAIGPFMPYELMPAAHTEILALALAVVATSSVALLVLPPPASPRRLVSLISTLDVVLVTAVVAATGGPRSVFAFLYVLSVTAACVLLSRTGGLAMAGLASLLYASLVFGRTIFPLTHFLEAPQQDTTALEVLTIFMNSATFMIVAIVAGGLAERFHVAHRELETQRRDVRDLQAFRDLIFHCVGTGLVAVDGQGTITAFNRAAEAITGTAAARALGRLWASVFGEAVALTEVAQAIAEDPRRVPRVETTVARPDGSRVPVRLTFSALRAGDGTPVGLIAVCDDLSVLREMESRLRRADRLATLGRMSANIAHEIRNPLASLTGAIEALATTGAGTETRTRLADIVLRESARLNGIITDFLAYARPAPLTRAQIDVSELLDEVLVLVEHRAQPGRLKVVREFAPAISFVVDPQQFRQALWNLCLNALDAMPDGGELRVAAAVDGSTLRVEVGDTGDGIAPGDVGHLFEPFFSTKATGSGLGLPLVHRIAQEHGGDVEVASAPGHGTTFTLTFPGRHA